MKELMEIFRANEIDKKTRARIIIKMGKALNHQITMNWTQPIVYELVKQLDPDNKIFEDKHFVDIATRYD
jgi:hypothetical protein